MKACPSPQQLDQYATGHLSDFDRSAVDAHVQSCSSCRDTVTNLRRNTSGTIALRPTRKQQEVKQLPPELADHPRYRVVGLIEVGGMGAVFKAEHRLLERPVVLKVIRRDLLDSPEQEQRFLREAKLAAGLMHPNIVTVFEAEQVGQSFFLVMEYLEGQDLGRMGRSRGPLPVAEACGYAIQAARGLHYLHERGLVHRDIKPSNLFVAGDTVKILDMGLAVLRDGGAKAGPRITERGQVLGTVDYMAPEQWEGSREIDARADVYSLGCTLFDLLAGRPPFSSSEQSSLMKQMWAHSLAPVPSIRDARPEVPEALQAVLARMMAKKPEDRYRTAAEAAAALEPFVSGAAPKPPPPPAPSRRVLLVAGLAALLLAGVAAWLRWQRPEGPAAGRDPVRVGVLHSRTGTMSISEKPVIDATLFALAEVNAAGGVLGRRVEAVIEDGASDWPTFARQAEKLITEDRVSAVFGCWTSASRKTVKPVFEKHGHLLFYPVQYEGLEQSPNIVYLGAAPNQQILPAVRWCCAFLGKKRLFLVGSDYVFPHCANAIIKDHAKGLGAEVVGEEYLLLGGADTGKIIERIKAAKPDLILNTINGDSNVAFFRALRAAGVTPAVTPTVSFSISEEELGGLRAADVEGDYAAWNYFQSIDGPINKAFVERFRAKYGAGRIVSDPMEAAYIGVHVWAQAVRAAGTADVAAVREAVKGQGLDAPEGRVTVDAATRHLSKFIRIGKVEGGRFKVVYASDTPIDPVPYPETRTKARWHDFLNDLHLKWGGGWENTAR